MEHILTILHRRLSYLTLLAIVLVTVNARIVDFNADIDCYIKYLNSNNILKSIFSERGVSKVEDCDEVVKSFVNGTYAEAALELRKDEHLNEFTPCMMSDLRLYKYADYKMLQKVYELSTTLTEDEKQKGAQGAQNKVEEAQILSVQHCMIEKALAAQFDGYFENKTKADETEIYCKRKYVIDNNLIDTKVYSFEINPSKTDFGDLNCDKSIRTAADALEARMESDMKKDEEVSDDYVECIKKVHREGRFFETTLIVDVLTHLDLTDEQKEEERRRFVKVVAAITGASMLCSLAQHD